MAVGHLLGEGVVKGKAACKLNSWFDVLGFGVASAC